MECLNFNTLRPRQNGRHFADDIFKCIFVNENVWIPIRISLKFAPMGPINNIPSLVQIMAWRREGNKPLSEPMMVSSPTHICVTRPQWVKLSLTSQLFHQFNQWQTWPCCWDGSMDKSSVTLVFFIINFRLKYLSRYWSVFVKSNLQKKLSTRKVISTITLHYHYLSDQAVSLQWHHKNVLASQTTSNSSVCSTACSGWQ